MIYENKFLFIAVAIFGNVLPFNLISLSEIHVDSVVAATLIGTMPLFTVLISLFVLKNQTVNFLNISGIIVGFIGMLIFINPSKFTNEPENFIFFLLIIFSAFSYGLSANIVKKITNYSPIEIATYTTILATIFSFPVLISSSLNSQNFFLRYCQI